jgi:hypothetical protein
VQDPNPIIDEIRAIRDSIAEEHEYDIAKIAAAVREREVKSGRTYVHLPPREPVPVKKAG